MVLVFIMFFKFMLVNSTFLFFTPIKLFLFFTPNTYLNTFFLYFNFFFRIFPYYIFLNKKKYLTQGKISNKFAIKFPRFKLLQYQKLLTKGLISYNPYLFKFKFRFINFFFFKKIFFLRKKSKLNLSFNPNQFLLKTLNFKLALVLRKKKIQTISGIFSYYSIQVNDFRSKLFKNISYKLKKNYFKTQKKKFPYLINQNNFFFFKKYYFNNFFYLNSFNISSKDLYFLIKLQNFRVKNSIYNWIKTRPTLFIKNFLTFQDEKASFNVKPLSFKLFIHFKKNFKIFKKSIKKNFFFIKNPKTFLFNKIISYTPTLISRKYRFSNSTILFKNFPKPNYFVFRNYKLFKNHQKKNLNPLLKSFFQKKSPFTRFGKFRFFKFKFVQSNFYFFKLSINPLRKVNFLKTPSNKIKNYSNILFKNTKLIKNYSTNKFYSSLHKSFIFLNFFTHTRLSLNKSIPFIATKSFTKFVLNFNSFIYTFRFLTNNLKNFSFITSARKHLYSFAYKNDLNKIILRRYLKSTKTLNYIFYKPSLQQTKSNFTSNLPRFSFTGSHISSSNFGVSNPNWPTLLPKLDTLVDQFSNSDFINIKRIKFKPGYSVLWRNARTTLKTILNLNFTYQHRLTKYLLKLSKFVKIKTILFFESTLLNTLLGSKLIPDYQLAKTFIQNKMIFVNGFVCSNANFQLQISDFIQLIIHLKYYIFYKWVMNWSLKKKLRLKINAKKKLSFNKSLEDKQRSFNYPSFVLNEKYASHDVFKHVEVDYFTLSCFIVYQPLYLYDFNYYDVVGNKFGVINLYNWKYIN